MFDRIPDVGPREAVDTFEAKSFHELEHANGTSEAVPVQAVLVHAFGGVDVRTQIKWTEGTDDHALFSEDADREVFFKRAGATGIEPHAALASRCGSRDVWSGIPVGDDFWGHDLLSDSHGCDQ